MSDKQQELSVDMAQSEHSCKHCLNCGTELQGDFCHNCGQSAASKLPKLRDFVQEYIFNTFNWDSTIPRTLLNLVCRPGRLTIDFMAGKFVSQEHPLKLNMFLLFLFVSMFLLFANTDNDKDSVTNIDKNEIYYPHLQMAFLNQDAVFVERMKASPRDTVQIYTPLALAEAFPDIMEEVAVEEDTNGKGLDRWTAVVPHALVEEHILVANKEGYYVFNTDPKVVASDLVIAYDVWKKLVGIISTYFPMLMLFTAPLLALAVAIIQRRRKQSFILHFIFSLHYTAFLEVVMMAIYALYLIASPPMTVLQWILRIASGVYLTLAFRKVYEQKSWFKALTKALFTYVVYMANCLFVLVIIVIVASFIVISAQI